MNDSPLLLIYGGTFDPLHIGHHRCIELALHKFPDAYLAICPAYEPLLDATSIAKKTVSDFAQRCQTLRNHYHHQERIAVLDIEKLLPRPSLTINLIHMLRVMFPAVRMGLILGQDQYASFAAWQGARDILSECDLVIANRSGAPDFFSLEKHLKVSLNEGDDYLQSDTFNIYRIEDMDVRVSGTEIRSLFRRGQPVDKDWLFPDVYNLYKSEVSER